MTTASPLAGMLRGDAGMVRGGTGMFQGNVSPTSGRRPAEPPQFVREAREPRALPSNSHPAPCSSCGQMVGAGEGTLERHQPPRKGWKVTHKACPLFTQAPAAEAPSGIWPGIYTVVIDGSHRTFRIEQQASDASFAPGKRIISLLVGPDNGSDYKPFGFVDERGVKVWSRQAEMANSVRPWINALVAHPEAALKAKHCGRCNSRLTHPDSIARGFGPECAEKGI